jgi:Arc/MetJ-type ribon-helix-helix transcriptional regulator
MEHISIKLEASIAKKIEKCMQKFHYSTKTEFIRDAIRMKIWELEHAEQLAKFKLLQGSEPQRSDEEFERARQEAFDELAREHGLIK